MPTATLDPQPEVAGTGLAAPPPRHEPLRRRLSPVLRVRFLTWPWGLAFVCLALYICVGVWLLFGLHYVIGDAMVRATNARIMLFGRDPHLAAIGFVWMPLPVLCTLPLTLVLEPFGLALFAGALGTALAGSLTVVVLARVCRDLGLRQGVSFAICAAYGFNPVVVFFSANGMSEAWFLLFASVAVLAFLRWWREPEIRHLGLLAIALCLCVLTRYESLGLLVVVGAAAALRVPRRRWIMALTATVLPGVFAFAVWLLVNQLIQRDWLFWLRALQFSADPGRGGRFIPADRTLASGTSFAAVRSLAMSPQLFLLTPVALWLLARRRRIEGATIVACAATIPAAIAYEVAGSSTYGNPRYFVPLSLFAALLGAWSLAQLKRPRAWAEAGLVALLVLGAASATVYEAGPNHGNVESEYVVFSRLLGRRSDSGQGEKYRPQVQTWERLAHDLDAQLTGPHRALVDISVSFPALAYTRRPDRWVVSSDRDFEPIAADPVGRVDWLVVSSSRPGPLATQFQRILGNTDGGHWEPWHDYGIATVYRYRSGGPA
jgi:hypothetical protein